MAIILVIWESKNIAYHAALQVNNTKLNEPKVVLVPGFYKIQLADKYLWLDIKTNGSSEDATEISLNEGNLVDPAHGPGFSFYYHTDSGYHSPLVFMMTGNLVAGQSGWADVGLKGRILTKIENKRSYVLLHGQWITNYSGSKAGFLIYQGHSYRYNPTTGNWEQTETTTQPSK